MGINHSNAGQGVPAAGTGRDGGSHPIQGLMKTAMESIQGMIDVNTVVGEAVRSDDGRTTIIPVSRVSLGFVAGGGEYGRDGAAWSPFGGGSGAGVTVQPVGFLVVNGDKVRLLPIERGDVLDSVLNAAPNLLEQLQGMLGRTGTRAAADPGGSDGSAVLQ